MSRKKFQFLPSIATADIAYIAFGRDYNELFENAGLALESVQVDPDSLERSRARKVELEAESIENLLFSFLEELVYLKDAEQLLFNRLTCGVKKVDSDEWMLEARLTGAKIDPQRHKLKVDVKAVTRHLFKIGVKKDRTFYCQVVLDI